MIANIDPVAGELKSPDFRNLVDLLAILSEATNRMDALKTAVNDGILEVVDDHKEEYAKLQQTLAEAEDALEILARRNPEWFAKKKSLTTPYGAVSLKENPPKLEVRNEELSIVLIESEAEKNPEFNAKAFLRERKELNLETLQELDDAMLAKFRLKRTHGCTFSAKPAKLDLGQAVKDAAKPE